MPVSLRIGFALAVSLAALSLALPYMPVYDPWGWLVWGGELAELDLATSAGPSWKPLPVFVDAALSLLGDAAPDAWLLIARSGWLIAPVLAAWLAAALSGPDAGRWRYLAAALAAGSVALSADAFTPPTRQFTGGLSEPLLVTLVLAAVALALRGRTVGSLWAGFAASLLRPECWPFLVLWAWREARRDAGLRLHAIAVCALVPLAWFVPDLLASGNALEGSQTARQGGVELGEVLEVAGRALAAPLAAAWIGVALFFFEGGRRDPARRVSLTLLLGASAWIGLVAAMAVFGYAGLPRFLAPATAVISVVGAAAIARAGVLAFAAEGRRALPATAVALALCAGAVGFALRAAEVPGDVSTIEAQTRSQEDLFELAESVGSKRLLSCGGTVRVTQLLAQTSLAWKLGEPIGSVSVRRRPRFGVALSTRPLAGRPLGRAGAWRAAELPCLSSRPR